MVRPLGSATVNSTPDTVSPEAVTVAVRVVELPTLIESSEPSESDRVPEENAAEEKSTTKASIRASRFSSSFI